MIRVYFFTSAVSINKQAKEKAMFTLASCIKNLRPVFRKKCKFNNKKTLYSTQNAENKNNTHYSTQQETHFGFQTVKESEKAEKVYEVFEDVATTYDKMNDAMSLGIHRIWKDIFVHRLSPTSNSKILDVAGGTGDIAFRISQHQKNSSATVGDLVVCDINAAMLDVGRQRAEKLGLSHIQWMQGDAEKLSQIKDNTFDAYTIAFGIRNVVHIDKALSEAYRILRPGGRFMCLEFSQVNNENLRWLYDQYSFQMIPVMGQLIAGQWKAYQYLVESIRQFPNQENFKCMIENAGFRQVTYEDLTFGIVAIHSGFKL